MMSEHDQSIEAIKRWVSSAFPSSVVTATAVDGRLAILFQIEFAQPQAPVEFEVTGRALEDNSAEVIISDLNAQRLRDRLLSDPTMRLRYHANREIPNIEEWVIVCDGKRYNVIRDEGHNVRISDQNSRLLLNIPNHILVLPSSIFRRPERDWQSDILRWKAADQ